MRLVYNQDEIYTHRISDAKVILKNISTNQNLIVKQIPLSQKIIFAAADISGNDITNFAEWRFKTPNIEILASYYEIWNKISPTEYYLHRVYIHLYNNNEDYLKVVEDGEYVLLHCDPNEEDDADHRDYKRSPHIHVKSAYQPLPHSHLALNLNDLDQVLSSREELNKALFGATKLLREQVLDLH